MSDELRADVRRAIVAPVVSEKSYGLLDEGKYTFYFDCDDFGALYVAQLAFVIRLTDAAIAPVRRADGGRDRRGGRARRRGHVDPALLRATRPAHRGRASIRPARPTIAACSATL